MSKTHNWINELDEFENQETENNNIELNDDKDLKISNLENKIKELEAQLKLLQPYEETKQLNKIKQSPKNKKSSKKQIEDIIDDELEKELENLLKQK